jgi:hypothetical protein
MSLSLSEEGDSASREARRVAGSSGSGAGVSSVEKGRGRELGALDAERVALLWGVLDGDCRHMFGSRDCFSVEQTLWASSKVDTFGGVCAKKEGGGVQQSGTLKQIKVHVEPMRERVRTV